MPNTIPKPIHQLPSSQQGLWMSGKHNCTSLHSPASSKSYRWGHCRHLIPCSPLRSHSAPHPQPLSMWITRTAFYLVSVLLSLQCSDDITNWTRTPARALSPLWPKTSNAYKTWTSQRHNLEFTVLCDLAPRTIPTLSLCSSPCTLWECNSLPPRPDQVSAAAPLVVLSATPPPPGVPALFLLPLAPL